MSEDLIERWKADAGAVKAFVGLVKPGTSGPWRSVRTMTGKQRVDGDESDGWVPVADLRQGKPESVRNGELIAAAPSMRLALDAQARRVLALSEALEAVLHYTPLNSPGRERSEAILAEADGK